MSVTTAGSGTGIDLASERPFRLSGFEVWPATKEIVAGDARQTLEPRVLQVLIVLMRRLGEVVSREELTVICWAGRTVGPEALNRCIAVLRRPGPGPFAHGFEIETIPKVGYRLLDRPALGAADRARPEGRRIPSRELILATAGALLLASAIIAWSSRPREWAVGSLSPLAATPVAEQAPAISPDGRHVAYALGDDSFHRDIYVQAIGAAQSTRFTDEPGDETAPAWSPDGREIVYTSLVKSGPCRIRVRAFSSGPPRDVAPCLVDTRARAVFTADGRALLVTERSHDDSPQRVYRLDPLTGGRTPLTDPPADSVGDVRVQPSPDGRALLLVRRLDDHDEQLVVHDLVSNAQRVVVGPGMNPRGATWLPDGQGILFQRDQGPLTGLWTIPRAGGVPRSLTNLPRLADGMALSGDGRLIVQVDRSRSDIALAPSSRAAATSLVSPANAKTSSPVYARDGALAFISDRSGASAIWIAPPGTAPRKLIDARAGETIRWSNDGGRLAYAVTGSEGVVLHMVDRAGEDRASPGLPFHYASTVTWSEDDRSLVFGALDGRGWRVWRWPIGATAAALRSLTPYGFWDVEVSHGVICVLAADNGAIWRIDDVKRPIWRRPPGTPLAGWRILDGKLVWIDFVSPGRRRLIAQPLLGGDRRVVANTPDMSDFGQFDRDPISGRYAYVRAVSTDADLFAVKLSRN